jgi:serine/threonine-protein phosphatase 2A regulatory subunit B''
VIEILSDHTGFWKYDNRESLPGEDDEEEGEEGEEEPLAEDDADFANGPAF